MNNSVVFAGFAATSPAMRIVDAHAKLVIATDAGKRAGKFVQAVVKGKPWAIVRRSDYDFFEGELDQLYTGSQKV
jgi:acyl-coenzyme A synthetase/AMP-(fatty) acid ligase